MRQILASLFLAITFAGISALPAVARSHRTYRTTYVYHIYVPRQRTTSNRPFVSKRPYHPRPDITERNGIPTTQQKTEIHPSHVSAGGKG